MKVVVLAAIIVAVSFVQLSSKVVYGKSVRESVRMSGTNDNNEHDQEIQYMSPWQVGNIYQYEVETHTLSHLPESASSGNTFRARFLLRVKAPGQIQAKLERPEFAQIHQHLDKYESVPNDLRYQPAVNLDKPFEIYFIGGRVVSLKMPVAIPLAQENLLKGLISALQVDLSTHKNKHTYHDTYDDSIKQGVFRKMETDITGDCETLYTISPVASEWRRELPEFASEEEPIEISKSKHYGHCHHRVDYHFGVPYGAEWTGTAHHNIKDQLIKRATVSRILVGKNGPIYKAETTSTVNVHPLLHGEQQAEVHSKVSLRLVAYNKDSEQEWEIPENIRDVKSLLYSLTQKPIFIDESSHSSESHEHVRNRRSAQAMVPSLVNKRIVKREHHTSSSSSSSSSSYSNSESSYVNDDIPKNNEPAYAALYLNPQPHVNQKQNAVNAQKLAQELAQQIQNPNNWPKTDVLSKFNILVRVIASMSTSQLNQASRSMEAAKGHKDNTKSEMWMIYRDALVQAGTLPAFQQIMSWIQSQKLQGSEASAVVSFLSRSLRYPTKEIMSQFFEMALSPQVKDQSGFNVTALFAATTLINMAQVNNYTAHHYYPTHMYGRLSHQYGHFVINEILPRLKEELSSAVQNEDSHKIQVYIRAIGNIGHRGILEIFAPYLEGKIPTSTYNRARIVESLKVLASQRDKHVRVVLYSILRNTAEPYQVRVAAIQSILVAEPSTTMMQGMAEMTHNDPSIEVRAALKSVILAVAKLKHPRYLHLARTADAVKGILTKEEFGWVYSNQQFIENFDDEPVDNANFFTVTGSKDNLLPNVFKFTWKNRREGYGKRSTISATASNTQKLYEWFVDLFQQSDPKYQSQQSQSEKIQGLNHRYSADKIAEELNIPQYEDYPLEAALFINILNQQRLYTISEQDKRVIAQTIRNYLISKHNLRIDYTNIFNLNQVSIMFPIASGMPFIYKYKEPTIIRVRSKTEKGQLQDPENVINMDKEIHYTYAQNYDGNVGFLDTLSNNVASVGMVNKLQIHIPIKIHICGKSGHVKVGVKPLNPEHDTTIVHYSVWPYSANQQKDSLVPISYDQNTKLINRQKEIVSIDSKYGLEFGTTFQIHGYSYSEDYKNIENIWQFGNPLSNIIAVYKQKDVAQTHFNLKYLGKQSKSKSITITAVYDTLYNQKQEGQFQIVASEISDPSNSVKRIEELTKRVVTGIDTATAKILDLSVAFELPQISEYVLTFAIAESLADPKAQFALHASINAGQNPQGQVNVVGAVNKPHIHSLNFQESLKSELKMQMEADIRFGQNENIHLKGEAGRNSKFTQELQNHPKAKQCYEEISSGNNYLHACYKMIVMANTPNYFKQTITYKGLSDPEEYYHIENNIRKAVEIILQGDYSPTGSDSITGDGQVTVTGEADYFRQVLNLHINTITGTLLVKDISIPRGFHGVFSFYSPIHFYERVLNYYTKHQFKPYCSVDSTQIKTFSNRQYNYTLSPSWHVVMQNNRQNHQEQLAILARRPIQQHLEVYISYRSPYGKDLEIEIAPGSELGQYDIKINTDASKVSDGHVIMYWDNYEERPFLDYHIGEDGVLKLHIRENRIRILYDAQRLIIFASDDRNINRGICGYMSGEPRDDYFTPNGLVDQPQYYGAAYALIDENSDSHTKELQEQAKSIAYQPQRKYTAILQSDALWKQSLHSSSSEEEYSSQNVYRARSYLKEEASCKLQKQVQFYENYGEICITTKPLSSCQSHCKSVNYKVQAVQVVCKPNVDQQFQAYKEQIRQGQNPKVNGGTQTKQYQVPTACKA